MKFLSAPGRASLLGFPAIAAFGFAAALLFPRFTLAQEASVSGLTVPEFDAAGNLVRRLKAESGTAWTGKRSQLKNGTVEFFAGEKDLFARVATLDFPDASYDPLSGLITGEGHVVLHSPRGDLAGDGFQYDLARNRLRLKSKVTFDRNGVHIEGGEGEADLAEGTAKDAALILRATIKQGVVVNADASAKLDFDRAKTESAVYAAIDETVVLASPVETWRQGKKAVIEGQGIRFHLGNATKPPLAPERRPAASAGPP